MVSLARAALLLVVLLGTSRALAPAEAQAFDSYYYCSLKPSNQWCDGRANGTYDGLNSWDWQEGWYPGTWDNTVTACQHVWKPADGSELGSSCAYNYTSHIFGNITCSCYEAEVKQISGGPHTIYGHADSAVY